MPLKDLETCSLEDLKISSVLSATFLSLWHEISSRRPRSEINSFIVYYFHYKFIRVTGRKIKICDAFFPKFYQNSSRYSTLYLILRFTKKEADVGKQAPSFALAVISKLLMLYPK